jgi:hypothetical protein
VERIHEGKLDPTVDDFMDDAAPLRGQFNGRVQKYEQEGWDLCYDDQ